MNSFHEDRIYNEHDHRAEPPQVPPDWEDDYVVDEYDGELPEHDPYWNECYDEED